MEKELFFPDYFEGVIKFSYNKEINNFEFVDLLDSVDVTNCKNYEERDFLLKKHGKKLFKKHPLYKNKEKNI